MQVLYWASRGMWVVEKSTNHSCPLVGFFVYSLFFLFIQGILGFFLADKIGALTFKQTWKLTSLLHHSCVK